MNCSPMMFLWAWKKLERFDEKQTELSFHSYIQWSNCCHLCWRKYHKPLNEHKDCPHANRIWTLQTTPRHQERWDYLLQSYEPGNCLYATGTVKATWRRKKAVPCPPYVVCSLRRLGCLLVQFCLCICSLLLCSPTRRS